MKIVLVFCFLLIMVACSNKEEASSNAHSSFDPLKANNEDPLKLGSGACKVEKKEDCDTPKK